MNQRYELMFHRAHRHLQVEPRVPITVQMKDLVSRMNELFKGLPGIPVIGELLKQALATRMSSEDISRIVEILYGNDEVLFHAFSPGAKQKRHSAMTIRHYWMTYQWNAKTDLQIISSEREIEMHAWTALQEVPGTREVILTSSNEIPKALALTSGSVALFELEALLRACEQRLGIMFIEPPKQMKRGIHDQNPSWSTTYARGSGADDSLVFITPGGSKPIPFFEMMYHRCALHGIGFNDFLALRGGHADMAA